METAYEGTRLDGPPGFDPVPAGRPADLILLFLREAAGIERRLPELGRLVFPAGALWAACPRKAAGHLSDLGDSVIRAAALAHGLVDVKVAMIDDDWSGLKLVWRLSER